MGASSSKLDRSASASRAEDEGRPACGLENYGNTCYVNSILQALYACRHFRERLLAHHAALPADAEESLLTCLGELFKEISQSKKRAGVVAPRRFVSRLRKDNELFRSYMHQDAHEFLNFLLNSCCDLLEKEELARLLPGEPRPRRVRTWVHELFEGTLSNQTRCLWCEASTSREEPFLDLSLEVQPASSLGACLRGFSGVETLGAEDKFHCDACCGLQEAQKRLLVKEAPPVLALHLKRFKYSEQLGRHKKLTHRVDFPLLLRLPPPPGPAPAPAAPAPPSYRLFAVVVHVGSGPNHGHYVTLARSGSSWVQFDDDAVERCDAQALPSVFGAGAPAETTESAAGGVGGVATAPGTPKKEGGTWSAMGGGFRSFATTPPPPSSSDAYILFYEVMRPGETEEEEEEEEEEPQRAEAA